MLLNFESFTWVDWLLSLIGLFIAGSSAAAAWYGAIISRRNQKQLEKKSKVSLRVKAEHHRRIKSNTTRDMDGEVVRIRVFNEGRQVEVEKLILLLAGVDSIPRAFGQDFKGTRTRVLSLEHHKSHVLTISVNDFLKLEQIAVEKKPLRLFLKDGDRLDLSVQGIGKIMRDLNEFKSDLKNGYEILLPNVFAYSGNSGWSIEQFEGKEISEELEIREEGSQNSVSPEDDAAWREGRNPQKEAASVARERKPASHSGRKYYKLWLS
jgi:hypothetical protein